MNKNQVFPVIEQYTGNLLGFQKRNEVHKKGSLHKALKFHIIRFSPQDSNKLQILVQKRSSSVDISKNKFDQSLATQVIDKDESLEKALVRGLKEELGLNPDNYLFHRFNTKIKFRIIKKYSEDKRKYNREHMSLFFVYCQNNNIKLNSKKVASVKWMDWKEFVNSTLSNPSKFTKSLRIYIVDSEIRKEIKKTMYNFLLKKENKFSKKGEYWYYSSAFNKDILIKKNSKIQLSVYNVISLSKPLCVKSINTNNIKVVESKKRDQLTITYKNKNGSIARIDDAFSLK